MEQEKITYFLAVYGRYYPEDKIPKIIKQLKAVPDGSFEMLNAVPKKDPLSVLTYSLFLGFFGIDRMMIGEIGKGLIKLAVLGVMCILDYGIVEHLTIGEPAKTVISAVTLLIGCIWVFVDWGKIEKLTKEKNYSKLIQQL